MNSVSMGGVQVGGGERSYTSRSIPYSSNSATYPDPAVLTSNPNKLAYRSDTLCFGVNAPNGNAQVGLDVYGTPVDIGYVIRAIPISTGSCYIQTNAIGSGTFAGFTFHHATGTCEWRMAVTETGTMRWHTSNYGASPYNRIGAWLTARCNLVLGETESSEPSTGLHCLAFENATAPTAASVNSSTLYTEDVASSSELKVMNEADEVTQLSGDMTLPSGKLLRFGGTSSSEVALKRSSAVLQTRLADDSTFAQHSALEFMNNRANFLMRTAVSWTNGAAGNTGTLGTAPTAGDPTKWIPVDDNGVTRYIPAW